jgi:SAM-dependent methyltransferase
MTRIDEHGRPEPPVDGHERATQAAYDLVAEDYAELLRDALTASVWDRSVLAAFAELVLADGGGPVVDVGCGPGRITGHLSGLGLDVYGVDLSPGMVEVARRTYPDLRFEAGSMAALGADDEALAGVVAWYSVIHTPPAEHPAIYRELARVLRPGGRLVLAFQVGDEVVHLEQAYGHALSLDAYRLSPEMVTDQLHAAGFVVTARLVREPVSVAVRQSSPSADSGPPQMVPEQQRQAYLVARKPN